MLNSFDTGVMEYWSVEKDLVDPIAISPTLQCSNTPKLVELKDSRMGCFFLGYCSEKILDT